MPEAESKSRRVFAFPEFWPTVEKEYPKFIEVGPKALTAMHSVADRAYSDPEPHKRAILNLSMVAGITFTEIITLTVNGMGHGAMRNLRTLLEISINAEYLRLNPDEFQDYKEWFWVERFKEQEYLRENADEIFKQLDPSVVKEVEDNMARVRPRFERMKFDGTKELRSSWCSRNLADRSIVSGHIEAYRLINPISSGFVHGTMYGMIRYFDAEKDVDRIGVPPTLEESDRALSGAHHCMVRVVKTLSETFNVAVEPTAEQLEKDWHYAWAEGDRQRVTRIKASTIREKKSPFL